ncbi:endonuclease [Arthrobacter sp. RIT-PI-e]|uniref:endonuclease/exonuclease/phosphatase family protein n=1 Tax=Arthrobacter sp. RIT-PI-e TaxID=1681197 RepID=UPI0006764454|nr:endonuclease/exonuclease/phosphatase family protein [Arthrobacter sp. RIT-PI-e]KNC17714.1 endonuclease [Arthrobacter sp. RIT-PI-e]
MRGSALCSATLLIASLLLGTAPVAVADSGDDARRIQPIKSLGSTQDVRFATYNADLNRSAPGELVRDISTRDGPQASAAAELVQLSRPDVLLLNEFDHDPGGRAAELFNTGYLGVGQNGKRALEYPYLYTAPVNSGVGSGFDLDRDGRVGGPEDALGTGAFEGQSGMVIYSRYPIGTEAVRTFRTFLWQDMPGALLPDNPATEATGDWYTEQELAVLPLSGTSHWDVPIRVAGKTLHVLASNPTSAASDGPERRNGRRNSDEIRFWSDYVTGGSTAAYVYDDDGGTGGLGRGERFVVMGDQNSDPEDGGSLDGAIDQLLGHRSVQDPLPSSKGAAEAAALQGGANANHRGDPRLHTADFEDRSAGNLRVDYVLPSRNLRVADSGVFWPLLGTPGAELTGIFPFPASDHRLVFVDVTLGGSRSR